jgi:hypothetical protein
MGSPPMEEALGLEEMKEAAHKRVMKSVSTLVTTLLCRRDVGTLFPQSILMELFVED